jgi:chromosome segregation ATPase
MTTEISERLRDPNVISMAVRLEAADEIERLTAREEQRAERLRLYMNRIGELEAEIERLRAALQEIADFPYVGTQASQKIWGIARRALEPKP